MKLVLFINLFFITIGYSQKIKVNKNIDVIQTAISYTDDYFDNSKLYCFDIMKNDTTTVYISKSALVGYSVRLEITNGKVMPKAIKWTDYPAYDGESVVELSTIKYKLEINDIIFKSGDTLRAKFTLVTKRHKYSEKKKFRGEIFHIIGGNQYIWENGKSQHQKFWKNGKQVFTVREPKED